MGTDEAVALGAWVGSAVAAAELGEAAGSAGLEEPQAPRARVAAVITAAAVRVRRVVVMS